MTFQEIMKFHPGNRDVYEEIKENLGQLLPFVGAGLTTPFYGTWSAALNNLGKETISDKAVLDELSGLVKTDYLGAAQFLEDKLGPRRLLHQMVRYFDKDKLDKRETTDPNRKVLVSEALYLLPKLFSCPVLTTNFDTGIEEVYTRAQGKHFPSLDPSSHNLREQARRLANTPCVFKLHGSVEAGMADYDKLVFTEKQYERHYAPNGEARAALSEFANGRMLLFLGCSLQQDKTVDLLQELADMGTLHYAIVHCEGKDKDTRLRELDDLGIQAILYPVEDHNDMPDRYAEGERSEHPHIAVRIILEQLLHDLYPDEYEKLNPCYSALPKPPENPYVYRARMTPLLGRDKELEKLIQFVTGTDDPFRWWALTAPGGSGKSKLAMELKDRVAAMDGWTCVTLEDFSDLKGFFDRYNSSTLVVVDYVQAHARELGEQMEALSRTRRTHPLRLLLVERNDPDGDFGWTEQLYEDVHHKDNLRNLSWRDSFLTLSPLVDKDLTEIIRTFAKNLRNKGFTTHSEPTEKDCSALLDRLKAIDKDLHRPLYALFLTGAWMEGEYKNLKTPEDVLSYIIERECTLLRDCLRELTNNTKKNQLKACIALYRLATARLGPKLEEVREHFPKKKCKRIDEAAEDAGLDGPEELLKQMNLLRRDTLVPMEPDLMGEYFVYQWLTDEAEPEERQEFLRAVWGNPHSAAIFFDRLFTDYKHRLNQKPDHWQLLLPPLEDLVPDPDEKDSWWYAILSKNAVYYCTDLSSCAKLADHLMKVKNHFPNNREILLELAGGLVNLMCKQDCNGRMATFSQQEELIGLRWKTDSEFAQELAVGLGNLSNKQDVNGIKDTVLRLENLRKKWPDDLEIARELAKGLTHLIKMQSPIDAKRTFNRLLILGEQFPKDRTLSGQIFHAKYHLQNKMQTIGAPHPQNNL